MNSNGFRYSMALVTGATSGIGRATAIALAEQNCNLLLIGRRADRLTELKQEILKSNPKLQVHEFSLDLQKKEAVVSFVSQNSDLLKKVDVLINNAGLAKGTEKIQQGQIEDFEAMIDTNIKGLLYLTRGILPMLLEHKSAHIINMGSVAGRWVYPGGAVYCATKFAVRALSEGLRMDLIGTPIRVSNIEPGMASTEFSEVRLGSKEKAADVYRNMTPLSSEDIAETVLWILQRPQHVNIQELVIFPTDQAHIGQVHRHK